MNKSLDACSLATHLSAYAALDGKIYRKLLCDLMIQNNLHIADSAVLASSSAVMLDFQAYEAGVPETPSILIEDEIEQKSILQTAFDYQISGLDGTALKAATADGKNAANETASRAAGNIQRISFRVEE